MRFAVSALVTLLAGFAASETLDLTGKCADHDGVGRWGCDLSGRENNAAVTCNSVLSGGGSYCSDCVRLDEAGFFECSCIGDNCA